MTPDFTPEDFRCSLKLIEGHFDPSKPRRLVSGVAISKTFRDAKGKEIDARGVVAFQLPLPLLLSHEPMRPLGRVLSIEAHGDQLHWSGEIVNSDRQVWVQEAWPLISLGLLRNISLYVKNAGPAFARDFDRHTLFEVSVCDEDDVLDREAGIREVSLHSRVAHLDGRPSKEVLWSAAWERG